MKEKREIATGVFKSVVLTMGVAVAVLSALSIAFSELNGLLLGIELFCIAVALASEIAELAFGT